VDQEDWPQNISFTLGDDILGTSHMRWFSQLPGKGRDGIIMTPTSFSAISASQGQGKGLRHARQLTGRKQMRFLSTDKGHLDVRVLLVLHLLLKAQERAHDVRALDRNGKDEVALFELSTLHCGTQTEAG
jgi:hypothetical protein